MRHTNNKKEFTISLPGECFQDHKFYDLLYTVGKPTAPRLMLKDKPITNETFETISYIDIKITIDYKSLEIIMVALPSKYTMADDQRNLAYIKNIRPLREIDIDRFLHSVSVIFFDDKGDNIRCLTLLSEFITGHSPKVTY